MTAPTRPAPAGVTTLIYCYKCGRYSDEQRLQGSKFWPRYNDGQRIPQANFCPRCGARDDVVVTTEAERNKLREETRERIREFTRKAEVRIGDKLPLAYVVEAYEHYLECLDDVVLITRDLKRPGTYDEIVELVKYAHWEIHPMQSTGGRARRLTDIWEDFRSESSSTRRDVDDYLSRQKKHARKVRTAHQEEKAALERTRQNLFEEAE